MNSDRDHDEVEIRAALAELAAFEAAARKDERGQLAGELEGRGLVNEATAIRFYGHL